MNKAQLIEDAAHRSGQPLAVVAACFDAFQDSIVRAVNGGENVSLTGFLNIKPVKRAARFARNPQTGERVRVPAKKVVRIRAGQGFVDIVNGQRKLPRFGVAVMKASKGSVAEARATGGKVVLKSRPPAIQAKKRANSKPPAKKATTRKSATNKRTAAKKTAAKKATSKRTSRG